MELTIIYRWETFIGLEDFQRLGIFKYAHLFLLEGTLENC